VVVFRTFALVLSYAACTSVSVNGRTLEGTHWRVVAIDGHQTPANGDYLMEFSGGQISGRFGCNRWSGNYAVDGRTLTPRQVVSTKIACEGLAMTFENQGLSVLNGPGRLTWPSGQKLRLVNGAGSIALELQH
jgi:heat shock protein HslJ